MTSLSQNTDKTELKLPTLKIDVVLKTDPKDAALSTLNPDANDSRLIALKVDKTDKALSMDHLDIYESPVFTKTLCLRATSLVVESGTRVCCFGTCEETIPRDEAVGIFDHLKKKKSVGRLSFPPHFGEGVACFLLSAQMPKWCCQSFLVSPSKIVLVQGYFFLELIGAVGVEQ